MENGRGWVAEQLPTKHIIKTELTIFLTVLCSATKCMLATGAYKLHI